jgi:hypothetical protein
MMNFAEWWSAVDELCRRHLACSWAELCGVTGPLEIAHAAGESPRDFIRWYADWYDQTLVAEFNPTCGGAENERG